MVRYPLKYLEDPKKVQYAPLITHMIAWAGFSAKYPQAREVLASLFWTPDEEAKMIVLVNEGKTPEQAADQWMKDNKDLIGRLCVIGTSKYK